MAPGTDKMYIIGSSLSMDKRAGMVSALGISAGCMVHTILAALGLSVILSNSQAAFQTMKYLGAGYLIFLGIKSWMRTQKQETVTRQVGQTKLSRVFFQGLLTNVLNPKAALFFLAFLPQFISTNNHYGALPFLALGFTFVTTATIWGILLSQISFHFGQKANQKLKKGSVMERISGIIFIGLGINLLKSNF
ncbi:MAG TPA: homoserine lactone transporter, partial [Eubacteriaceae bacterium]|nr:homoserine lactone transporter [Eubacteriaceae bacterium]